MFIPHHFVVDLFHLKLFNLYKNCCTLYTFSFTLNTRNSLWNLGKCCVFWTDMLWGIMARYCSEPLHKPPCMSTCSIYGCGFRLVSTCSGWHRQHSSADVLDKLWTSVIVEPLSRDELVQVIIVNLFYSGDLYLTCTVLLSTKTADLLQFLQGCWVLFVWLVNAMTSLIGQQAVCICVYQLCRPVRALGL